MLKCKSFSVTAIIMILIALILSSCAGSGNTKEAVNESKTPVTTMANEAEEPSTTPVAEGTTAASATGESAETTEVQPEQPAPEQPAYVSNIDNNIAAFKSLSYVIKDTIYKDGTTQIKYPIITGLKDKSIEKNINSLIKNDAMKYAADYDIEGAALDVGFQIAFAGKTLLSIKFIVYSNNPGAAHPNHSFYSTNIYIPMASKIMLTDMVKISDYFAEGFIKNSKYVAPNKSGDEKLEDMLDEYINSVDGAYLEKADSEEASNECFSYFTSDSLGVSVGVPFAIGGYALYEIKYEEVINYIYNNNEMWKDFPELLSKILSAGNDTVTSNISDFIPENWTILKQNGEIVINECDFDKNGNTDLVFAIEGTAQNGESAPRTLIIVSGNGDWTYTPVLEAKNVILRADQGGVMGDPFYGIDVKNGSIYLLFYGGSSWRWEKNYQFWYQDSDWYLIGAKERTENINTKESTEKDYNLNTGDYIIKQTNENGKVKEEKGNFDKRNKYKLSDFNAGKENVFDF